MHKINIGRFNSPVAGEFQVTVIIDPRRMGHLVNKAIGNREHKTTIGDGAIVVVAAQAAKERKAYLRVKRRDNDQVVEYRRDEYLAARTLDLQESFASLTQGELARQVDLLLDGRKADLSVVGRFIENEIVGETD